MKKLMLILIPLMLVSMLAAIELTYDGEIRTRAAAYNSPAEKDGGHIDSRMYFGLDGQLSRNLMFRLNLQMGDVIWGDGGGSIPAAVNVDAYEMYMDYRIDQIQSNVRIGQQYWKDHRGLIIDDSFSGITLAMDDLAGFKTMFGWIKPTEGFLHKSDDYNYFLVNMEKDGQMPLGLLASLAMDGDFMGSDDSYTTFTLMPYVNFEQGNLGADLTAFMGYHMFEDDAIDDEIGFGLAAKATMRPIDKLGLGLDIMFAGENGIAVLSPNYQNGLYIYGNGLHHDGVNLYWGAPYSWNSDAFFSAVGDLKYELAPRMNLFGALGFVQDAGLELNAGLEVDLVPNTLKLVPFAAFGQGEDEGPTNYVLGTTLKAEF